MRIPRSVALETLNHCNAKCVMCPAAFPIKRGTMTDDLFNKIVDEVKDYDPLPSMSLHGTGEPTLFKRLPERIEAITRHEIHIKLVTNGSLLNEKRCREILQAGVSHIEFSIESLDKNLYESIRVGLDLNEVMDNLVTCCRLRNEIRPETVISWMFVSHSTTNDSLKQIGEFFLKHARRGDEIRVNPRHNFGGKFKSEFKSTDNPCHIFIEGVNILYDGTMNMCCVDSDRANILGNVNENTILEIYNSEKYNSLVNLHTSRNRKSIPICSTCTVPEACGTAEFFTLG